MDNYVLFTDSSADLDEKMVDKLDVAVQNLTFTLDGKNYRDWPDWREISPDKFYGRLREGGAASTSQVNSATFTEAFSGVLREGKDVLYLAFSSGLSGTAGSAGVAADELRAQYPGRRVVVVDSLAASLGQGLLVWYAARMKKEGKSLDEVAQWVENNKLKLAHWFTVDDLNFLRRGGRLSGASALLGTMLNIKPVLHVDNEGHLIAVEKIRGRRQSLLKLVEHMEKSAVTPAEQTVFISHGGCLPDAEFVAAELKKRLGVRSVYINPIGPVIGSHAGPGTIALFFMAIER